MRNKFEKRINARLVRSKLAFEYEGERLSYIIEGTYKPDFIILRPSGKLYIETKGYLRPEDKRKLVAVKKCNPDIDLRILFYRLNKQYVKWADKNKIPWAIGKIPKEWLT